MRNWLATEHTRLDCRSCWSRCRFRVWWGGGRARWWRPKSRCWRGRFATSGLATQTYREPRHRHLIPWCRSHALQLAVHVLLRTTLEAGRKGRECGQRMSSGSGGWDWCPRAAQFSRVLVEAWSSGGRRGGGRRRGRRSCVLWFEFSLHLLTVGLPLLGGRLVPVRVVCKIKWPKGFNSKVEIQFPSLKPQEEILQSRSRWPDCDQSRLGRIRLNDS